LLNIINIDTVILFNNLISDDDNIFYLSFHLLFPRMPPLLWIACLSRCHWAVTTSVAGYFYIILLDKLPGIFLLLLRRAPAI